MLMMLVYGCVFRCTASGSQCQQPRPNMECPRVGNLHFSGMFPIFRTSCYILYPAYERTATKLRPGSKHKAQLPHALTGNVALDELAYELGDGCCLVIESDHLRYRHQHQRQHYRCLDADARRATAMHRYSADAPGA